MARFDEQHPIARWRTFWLLAAFALLIGIGVVTVLLPELEDDPAHEENAEETSANEALQE